MKTFIRFAAAAALLSSCQLDNPLVQFKSGGRAANCAVCGTWTYSGFEQRGPTDYVMVYARTRTFGNEAGLQFEPSGLFVERANAGWCGTPPITYADYPGRWKTEGDSLTIEGQYWGGPQRSRVAVVAVDPNKLVIKRVYHR